MKRLLRLLVIELVLLGLLCKVGYCEVDMAVIAQIESNNNSMAYNARSQAYGLYQITPVCLREWNNFNPTNKYYVDELFNSKINTKVAKWYLFTRIPDMLRTYGFRATDRNVLVCYNAGIDYVVRSRDLPQETVRYIEKYKRMIKGI